MDGQYELFIVRGTRQFRYGRAVFRADSNRPGELDRPDYDRLTADRHPRLLMDDEAFGSLMEQVRAGNNQVLNRLHATNLRNADIYGLAAAPLAYQLDAAEKRILHISSAALLRIFSCAYAYRARATANTSIMPRTTSTPSATSPTGTDTATTSMSAKWPRA